MAKIAMVGLELPKSVKTRAPQGPDVTLGERLKWVMLHFGWSNSDVAALTGRTTVTVSRWRNDAQMPADEDVERIASKANADGLSVSAAWLRFGGDELQRDLVDRDEKIAAEKGERLRGAREDAGGSIEEVASITGYSSETVTRWESGHLRPDLDTFFLLAKIYGQDPWYLDTGERWEDFEARQRIIPDSLPKDLRLLRDEMLIRWERLGADEREVAVFRSLLSGRNLGRHLRQRIGREPNESDVRAELEGALRVVRMDIADRARQRHQLTIEDAVAVLWGSPLQWKQAAQHFGLSIEIDAFEPRRLASMPIEALKQILPPIFRAALIYLDWLLIDGEDDEGPFRLVEKLDVLTEAFAALLTTASTRTELAYRVYDAVAIAESSGHDPDVLLENLELLKQRPNAPTPVLKGGVSPRRLWNEHLILERLAQAEDEPPTQRRSKRSP